MTRVLILLIACTMVFSSISSGQGEPGYDKMTLGANFEVSLPVGGFSDVAGTGYGGNIKYQYGANTHAVFTATAGYMVWTKKDLTPLLSVQPLSGTTPTIQPKAFNIFFGGKYYANNGIFGSLEGGLYFVNFSYEGTTGAGAKGNATYFMLPIGVGLQKSGVEVAIRYMLLHPDFNQVSLTLGYNFNL